jgi:hypothetical protein
MWSKTIKIERYFMDEMAIPSSLTLPLQPPTLPQNNFTY